MDECGVEKAALALTQARLEKLKEYEGCRVRICFSGDCWSGLLEEVDVVSATLMLRDLVDDSLVVKTIDLDDWELQVYKCPGDSTSGYHGVLEGYEDSTS